MKTCSKFFTYAAVAVFALSSCTSEKLKNDELNSGKTVTVHFGAETTDPSSKATLTPDGETAFKAAWENEDKILISYSFNNQPQTPTTGTWNLDSKSFEADLLDDNGDWVYKAAYPVPASDNSLEFGSNRTQKGNAYNSKYDIMIGSASANNAAAGKDDLGKDIVFKMDRQTAIAYFHFTSDLDEAIQSATLTVSGKGAAIANSAASINNFIFNAPAESNLTEINLTFEKGTAPSAKDFQLWFNVLPTTYETMSLTVETATKTFTISKSTTGEYVKGRLYKVKKDNIAWTNKAVTPIEQTVFLETFGTTSSTPAFSEYTGYSATAEMFTTSGEVNIHYSGAGKIGKNDLKGGNLSSGYTDASGLSGCYHTGTANREATILQISDINITDCVNISVSFGALGSSTSHKVSVYYSIDNGEETALITDGSITNANWTLLNANIAGTGRSLTLIFKHKPTKAWIIRMDDIRVVGTK